MAIPIFERELSVSAAFGQPNQEEFLKALQSRVNISGVSELVMSKNYIIDLAPR